MNKKQKNGILIALVVVLCIGVTVWFMLANKKTDAASRIAASFYEEYYYEQLTQGSNQDEIKKLLEPYEDKGLSVSIQSIGKIFELDVSKDMSKLEGCNLDESKVVIIPQSPYTVTDYSVEVSLSCD